MKEKFKSSMEKDRIILDDDFCLHESIFHVDPMKSQIDHEKKYFMTQYHRNFIVCECPWSIHGNTCKHAIKVKWLYFMLKELEPLLNQNAEPDIFDVATPYAFYDPPEIIMETPMIDENIDTTNVAIGSVDQDDEALRLAREELLGYLYVLQNSPSSTLTNT